MLPALPFVDGNVNSALSFLAQFERCFNSALPYSQTGIPGTAGTFVSGGDA
jgi:hypothetical protein